MKCKQTAKDFIMGPDQKSKKTGLEMDQLVKLKICVCMTDRGVLWSLHISCFHYVGTSVGSFIWVSTPVHRFGLQCHGDWFWRRHSTWQSAVPRSSLFPVQSEYLRNSSKSKSSFVESVKAKVWTHYLIYILVDMTVGYGLFTFTDCDCDSDPYSDAL